jgi:deoxyribodipyrimidine photo-lyase
MTNKKTIFWFRQDLRISDNPALFEAAKNGDVLAIYILDESNAGDFKIGGASKWWLHYSLERLNQSLENKLNFYCGNSREIILKLISEHQIDAVYWNRAYEPWRIREDAAIKAQIKNQKIECKSFNGSLLWEPWDVVKSDGTPYKVFTPFYRNGCLQKNPPRMPLPKPQKLALLKDEKNSAKITDLKLLPQKNWHQKMENTWQIGEKAAQTMLSDFLENGLKNYKEGRNHPNQKNVSRLSPYLHFGEVSPNQVWYGAEAKLINEDLRKDVDHFLSELGWREFSNNLLYHFPDLARKNFQEKFDKFPWQENKVLLRAWKKGQTGYPIVDAGMRELWQTGYMHNRVRMIVGSFLVKNLLLHWHEGEDWFWDCLCDADLANNSASWQWIAGSGADAAPYFRIFNPILQGEKFDAEGEYTKRFVPELKNLPKQFLFKPWEAPEKILEAAGVVLGKTYPQPIIDMKISRDQAMLAYQTISKQVLA